MVIVQREEERRKEFETVALPYMDILYRGALKMTRNEAEAQDLVQDTYLKAYQFFDKFKKGTDPKAWLFKILKNTFINKYRRERKTPEMVTIADAELSGELAATTTQEDEIFDKLLDDDLTSAMNALPEKFRLTIILSDLEGFKYQEIAETLDCPLGTVMSRLHRGRRTLRGKLWKYAKKRGYAV